MSPPRRPSSPRIPRGVIVLGLVSLCMDFSSEFVHALLPLYLATGLGASMLAIGLIEGAAEAIALVVKVFSGVLSDAVGRRKPLVLAGYGLAALTKPVFALAPSLGWIVAARFADRVGKGIRGAPRDYLLASDFLPPELRDAWTAASALALDGVKRAFDRAGDVATLRLHGDVHPGNVLWIDSGEMRGPHFVDFDDARTGPAMQDLWMLISGDRESMEHQLARVLEGYERFRAFDHRELHLVEALRTLRLLHYSAWIAQRWDDPAFPAAFPWFGTTRYWQDRILELREQIGAMDETPLVVV